MTTTLQPYLTRDLCIGFWAAIWNSGVLSFPQNATVLEIGCAEADWVSEMKRLRSDLHITAIDARKVDRPADVLIHGDVLTQTFPPASFDAIVAVSTIEHIGLGSYGDPIQSTGDTDTMRRCREWLTPDGWMYLDVPYRPHGDPRGYHVTRNYRGYDEAHLQSRLLTGWQETFRRVFHVGHEDSPFVALILRPA